MTNPLSPSRRILREKDKVLLRREGIYILTTELVEIINNKGNAKKGNNKGINNVDNRIR
jgi:hypothetical protein